MQELVFDDLTQRSDAPFDDYECKGSQAHTGEHFVCLFTRTDANGKHHYLVAERKTAGQMLRLTNAKEFKHAQDRAFRYYHQRISDLGT